MAARPSRPHPPLTDPPAPLRTPRAASGRLSHYQRTRTICLNVSFGLSNGLWLSKWPQDPLVPTLLSPTLRHHFGRLEPPQAASRLASRTVSGFRNGRKTLSSPPSSHRPSSTTSGASNHLRPPLPTLLSPAPSMDTNQDPNMYTHMLALLPHLHITISGSTISLDSLSSPSPSLSPQRSTPASSRSPSPAPGTDVEDTADHNAADNGDIDDTNPDDDADVEVESDLQPAHRAEALDVLATIELKFALLRERVYVEKMEGLAWEEALINEVSPGAMGILPNGGSSSKMGGGVNGSSSWMGSGMGMERVYPGPGTGKSGEWGRERERDGRLALEDDERERLARERDKRDRERKREQHDREQEREMPTYMMYF
ncbi:hypothetical protein DXG01_004704 [Tephrocybe rancida]|nr:hypothetical protein DXG01_004704 [Tephrocybe rancida]